MKGVSQLMQVVRDFHKNVAADVWPEGGVLRCTRCGKVQPFTSADAAQYLAYGWPKCCGQTMRNDETDEPET
jgi:hypothetical protein